MLLHTTCAVENCQKSRIWALHQLHNLEEGHHICGRYSLDHVNSSHLLQDYPMWLLHVVPEWLSFHWHPTLWATYPCPFPLPKLLPLPPYSLLICLSSDLAPYESPCENHFLFFSKFFYRPTLRNMSTTTNSASWTQSGSLPAILLSSAKNTRFLPPAYQYNPL